jgi:hypothetical protein
MTSVLASKRQVSTDGGLYVNLAALTGAIFTEASTVTAAADPTYVAVPTAVSWAAGAIGTVYLRDMGKTISGNGLTFRKVQLVDNDPATFGVGGTPANEFQTGYILLASGAGLGAQATTAGYAVAKVAKYGI